MHDIFSLGSKAYTALSKSRCREIRTCHQASWPLGCFRAKNVCVYIYITPYIVLECNRHVFVSNYKCKYSILKAIHILRWENGEKLHLWLLTVVWFSSIAIKITHPDYSRAAVALPCVTKPPKKSFSPKVINIFGTFWNCVFRWIFPVAEAPFVLGRWQRSPRSPAWKFSVENPSFFSPSMKYLRYIHNCYTTLQGS